MSSNTNTPTKLPRKRDSSPLASLSEHIKRRKTFEELIALEGEDEVHDQVCILVSERLRAF
jgi:hypothetical protein